MKNYAKIELLGEGVYRPGLQKKGCFVTGEELPDNGYYAIDVPTSVFRGDDECYAISKGNIKEGIDLLIEKYPNIKFKYD